MLKALILLVFLGIVMRAVRAVTGGGSRTNARTRTHEPRRGHRPEGSAPGAEQKPPVRREDIIDVPYEDS